MGILERVRRAKWERKFPFVDKSVSGVRTNELNELTPLPEVQTQQIIAVEFDAPDAPAWIDDPSLSVSLAEFRRSLEEMSEPPRPRGTGRARRPKGRTAPP